MKLTVKIVVIIDEVNTNSKLKIVVIVDEVNTNSKDRDNC